MNKKLLMIFAILIFTSAPTLLAFGEHIEGMLTAEEFSEVINKFARDEVYVQKHVNFTIPTRDFYSVYGDLANGDPEEAIKIFNHPDYPYNAHDFPALAIQSITNKRNAVPEYDQLFVHEIRDYKVDEQNEGLLISVNEKYANQDNYNRYKEIFSDVSYMDLPITFQVYQPTPFSGENSSDFIIPMMSFVIVTGVMIVFLVKKNKI